MLVKECHFFRPVGWGWGSHKLAYDVRVSELRGDRQGSFGVSDARSGALSWSELIGLEARLRALSPGAVWSRVKSASRYMTLWAAGGVG